MNSWFMSSTGVNRPLILGEAFYLICFPFKSWPCFICRAVLSDLIVFNKENVPLLAFNFDLIRRK